MVKDNVLEYSSSNMWKCVSRLVITAKTATALEVWGRSWVAIVTLWETGSRWTMQSANVGPSLKHYQICSKIACSTLKFRFWQSQREIQWEQQKQEWKERTLWLVTMRANSSVCLIDFDARQHNGSFCGEEEKTLVASQHLSDGWKKYTQKGFRYILSYSSTSFSWKSFLR